MGVRLSTIAEQVGLSRHQVARILDGTAKGAWGASAERAATIGALAARMGYRPNAAARSMRSGQFNAIALLHRPDQVCIPTSLLIALGEELARRALHLHLAAVPLDRLESDGGADAEAAMPRTLRELCVDALLVNVMHHIGTDVLQRVRGQRVPVVWLNLRDERDCVYPDDVAAFAHATRTLLELGHRRIVLVESEPWPLTPVDRVHASAGDRRAGYAAAMAEAGRAARVLALPSPGHADDDTIARLRPLLTGSGRATALLLNHSGAVGAVRELAASLGLTIPRDLSLIALAEDVRPEVGARTSRLYLPWRGIAAAAATMLDAKRGRGSRPVRSVAVAFDAPSRDSLAPRA